jgi:hypothetical protein
MHYTNRESGAARVADNLIGTSVIVCRVARCGRSAAIWGAPDVLPT